MRRTKLLLQRLLLSLKLSTSTSVDALLPSSGIVTHHNREPGGADRLVDPQRSGISRSSASFGQISISQVIAVGDISRKAEVHFRPILKDGLTSTSALTNNGVNEPTNIGAANFA